MFIVSEYFYKYLQINIIKELMYEITEMIKSKLNNKQRFNVYISLYLVQIYHLRSANIPFILFIIVNCILFLL